MKKILYFFAACIVIGLILSTVFASIPIFKFAGKEFLTAISKQDYPHAYGMLSKTVQSKLSIQEFQSHMQEMGLEEFKSVQWTDRTSEQDTKTGFIRGNVFTKQNSIIPIQIDYVLYQGTNWLDKRWTISNVFRLDKKDHEEPSSPPVSPNPVPH